MLYIFFPHHFHHISWVYCLCMFRKSCNIRHNMRDGCCYEEIVSSRDNLYPRLRVNELVDKPVATASRPASSIRHAQRRSDHYIFQRHSAWEEKRVSTSCTFAWSRAGVNYTDALLRFGAGTTRATRRAIVVKNGTATGFVNCC